jgi:hypothetical protein
LHREGGTMSYTWEIYRERHAAPHTWRWRKFTRDGTLEHKAGHKGMFIQCGTKIGLVVPWISTTAGDTLAERLNALRKGLGTYPHARTIGNDERKEEAENTAA